MRLAALAGRLLAVALVLTGCRWIAPEVAPDRMPRFEPLAAKPKIALVLGSGGPRGFAHIGVMKILEQNGIHPDLVVGCSVGSMVGAMSAYGMSATELEALSAKIKVAEFFDIGMLGGKSSGGATQNYVNDHVDGKTIEQLKIPFAAAATRVRDRKLVLFTHGDTGLAVRASSATPESFNPVRVGDEMYFDGDVASPVPIHAARSLGAQFVIAVDVSAYEKDTPASALREWVENDARRAKQVQAEAPEADILLHPNIGYYAGHDEEYRTRVIGLAEAYTRRQMPAIRAALAKAGLAQAMSTERSPEALASR